MLTTASGVARTTAKLDRHTLDSLLSVAMDLTQSLSTEQRYQRLLSAVRRVVPCDAVALLRCDEQVLVPVAADGLHRRVMWQRFVPDEHGGAVAGQLVVLDADRETGVVERIDCTRFGSGAYSIPSSVEHLSFETNAKFILAIETGGVFQRLQSHKFWQTADCILVSMAGVPTRATRRFIRKLSDECDLPVYAFVDCDPYGISNIYRTLKVGSGNAAHLSQFFCVPHARYLGVTPQDIVDYELPTHPLQDVDVKRAKDALDNDPFFKAHAEWRAAIEQLLAMGVRAEQQALAKWGLNYVIDEYLPAKLRAPDAFLP